MSDETTTELDQLIAKKVAAGLTPAHAREVIERQTRRDAKAAKAAKKAKAEKPEPAAS